MAKSIILQFVILLTFCFQLKSNPISKNYSLYYKQMNLAEIKILEKDFKNALNIYLSCFKEYPNHQYTDIYNASICAIKIRDFSCAKNLIQETILQGVKINEVTKNVLDSLPEIFRSEIYHNADSLYQIYLSRFDHPLKQKLDSMEYEEQYFLKNRSDDSYDSIVLEHAKVLKKILTEKGMPEVAMFQGRNRIPLSLIRHHFGVKHFYQYSKEYKQKKTFLDFSSYDLQPILLQAILEGKFSPSVYISCLEYNEIDKNKDFGEIFVNIDLNTKKTTLSYPPQKELTKINLNRKQACLESFEEATLKSPEIKCYLDQYPFEDLIAICKELKISKKNDSNISFRTRGEFIARTSDLQQQFISKFCQTEFLLPKSNIEFVLIVPIE